MLLDLGRDCNISRDRIILLSLRRNYQIPSKVGIDAIAKVVLHRQYVLAVSTTTLGILR